MAKREKKQRPMTTTRKYQSRVAQERRQIRYIRLSVIGLATVLILILLAGLLKTQVMDPAATRTALDALKDIPAATVNGTMISVADWQARVRYERQLYINQIAQISQQLSLFDPSTEFGQQLVSQGQAQIQEIRNLLDLGDGIAADVLDQMVEEQLIREEASRRGISVTREELQNYIEINLFAFPFPPTPEPVPTLPPPTAVPTATVTPSPTLTPTLAPTARSREDFESDYANYTQQLQEITRMSEEAWRSMIEGALYREKLVEVMGEDLETNVLHVKAQYIATSDQETADEFLARLDAGEDFAALVEEIEAAEEEAQAPETTPEPEATLVATPEVTATIEPEATLVATPEVTATAEPETEVPAPTTGSFDWSPISTLDDRFGGEFIKIFDNTNAGSYTSEAVLGLDGRYYILYVEGKEVRELADYLQEQQKTEQFEAWLSEQKLDEEGIVYGNWRDYIPREPALQG